MHWFVINVLNSRSVIAAIIQSSLEFHVLSALFPRWLKQYVFHFIGFFKKSPFSLTYSCGDGTANLGPSPWSSY